MKNFCFAFALLVASALTLQAQTLGSCQIFPSNNPWNERVDSLPVSWNSAAYLSHLAGKHLQPDFSIPFNVVGSSQPLVAIHLPPDSSYWDESDPGPMPIPSNALVEQPAFPNGDGHVLVVDTGNHKLYELYQGRQDQPNGGWTATSSASFALDSNNFRPDGWTSCDAAGLPIFPGLIRYDECAAGAIHHALRFTIPTTQKAWIFPARHEAGSTTDTTVMPMGTRLRLKASFDLSGFTGYAKVIATALKQYGLILADNGSAIFISGEPNPNWPSDVWSQLETIRASDLEVVNSGPVRTKPNQYADPVFPVPGSSSGLSGPATVYDTARVGDANATLFHIVNNGTSADTIARYALTSGTVFQISDSMFHIVAAGDSALVVINFAPIAPGASLDTLFLVLKGSKTPSLTIPLEGFGTEGIFHLSENPLRFDSTPVGMTSTTWITLSNPGNGELDVYPNTTAGTNPDFSVIALSPQTQPPFFLQPRDSEVAEFQFTPSIAGPDSSFFSLTFADTTNESYDTNLVLVGVGVEQSSVGQTDTHPFSIAIAPNPCFGTGHISMSGRTGRTLLRIFNSLGELVWTNSVNDTSIPLPTLRNGAYFVRATSGDKTVTEQFIVER